MWSCASPRACSAWTVCPALPIPGGQTDLLCAPVCKEEGSVGHGGGVCSIAPALGLELIAEVADQAAPEIKGERLICLPAPFIPVAGQKLLQEWPPQG